MTEDEIRACPFHECQTVDELEYQVAQLENEVALLKLEKGGISEGYSRVKAELDLRKGLKPGHTIVRDKPDEDYPNGNVYSHIYVHVFMPHEQLEQCAIDKAYDTVDKIVDKHLDAMREELASPVIPASGIAVVKASMSREHGRR